MSTPDIDAAITHLAREHSGQVLALVANRFGDLDLADEAVQQGLIAAATHWPERGIPDNPAGWLHSVAKRKAIDLIRRANAHDRRVQAAAPELATTDDPLTPPLPDMTSELIIDEADLPDERLRLVFLCCHPALNPDAQVALTLRLVGGLSTEEIAAAFLVPTPTLAQRISRAKRKIRDAGIPLSVPDDLSGRTAAVLSVLYLTFNEGYLSRADSPEPNRVDLCVEAIRLTEVLSQLLPDDAEVHGLLALQLFHHSRRQARFTPAHDLVLLPDQDRTQWNLDEIKAGNLALREAMTRRQPGPYQLQAIIASHHANARTADDTDWTRIAALYEQLQAMEPSPVVRLNRAVAVAMADGPLAGLALLDELGDAELSTYNLWHTTRGELHARAGNNDAARQAFTAARELTVNPAEVRHIERRITDLM